MSDIQTIKYRLVGAVVIVIGFALLWSLLLDHEAKRKVNEKQLDIPPQTFNVERFDIKDPQNAVAITDEELPVTVDDSDSSTAQSESIQSVETPKAETVKVVEKTVVQAVQEKPEATQTPKAVSTPVVAAVKKAPLPSSAPPKQSVVVEKAATSYSKLDDKGLPEAWVLQLASVKNEQNALDLKNKLISANFPAYVKSINTADGISYRVLVGPKLSREKAEIMANDIEKQKGIKGIIVRFQVGYER